MSLFIDDHLDRLCPVVTERRPYVVMTASAAMPAKCRGRYGRVAVVQTDGFGVPLMIRDDARGLVRIVRLWDRVHMGWKPGPKTAYARAKVEAHALCERLNREHKL